MHSTLIFAMFVPLAGADPTPQPLWTDNTPAVVGDPEANRPTLTAYLPAADKAVGTAVIVCPGGGYGAVMIDHEGKQVADWLNARGIAAFVLQYRVVVKGKRPGPLHPAPLYDVRQAIRTVRAKSKEFGIRPDRIGVWGFSAGGHLASSIATQFERGLSTRDSIQQQSDRPDFAILAYPVISMDPAVSHGGSRRNLLGDNPDPKLVEQMSSDKQVSKHTPPTFLFHTEEDSAVPIRNSILFKEACEKNGVPVELVTYVKGRHGVGLALKEAGDVSQWTKRLEAWMVGRGLLTK